MASRGERLARAAARRRGRARLAGAFALALAALACAAPPPAPRVLRVGTSGDYAPFSRAAGAGFEGFDITVVTAFATERGLALAWVPFRWPDLLADLAAERFDLALGGVTVRPERSLVGRFSLPLAETGAVALVREDAAFRTLADLDRPERRVAVNRGGHLERAARARLPHAALAPLAPNAAVLAALVEGRADAAISDTGEAVVWRREAPGLRVIGPFSRDRKAWLLRPEQAGLAAELDAWLMAREADGALARWRAEHLGAAGPRSADASAALLAAFDERLALMPDVATAKRARGLALEDPAREVRVIDAALAAAREAAQRAGRPAPPEPALRALWRAQIDAALAVQRATPTAAESAARPDLQGELRPALERIDERTVRLLVALATPLDCSQTRTAARDALHAPGLDAGNVVALADALVAASGGNCPAPPSP